MQGAGVVEAWRGSGSGTRTISSAFSQTWAPRYLPVLFSSSQSATAKLLPSSAATENHQVSDVLTRWQQSSSVTAAGHLDLQLCGRGDKRTKKGKRFNGSLGNSRHKKSWDTRRLREKWEMLSWPAEGSLLPRPFPPLLTRH